MSIYHLSISKLSRKLGQSSVRRAAYIMHSDYVDTRTGIRYNDTWRSGNIINLSSWDQDDNEIDTETLWQKVENRENRKDSAVSRSMIIALPKELELEDKVHASYDFIRYLTKTYNTAASAAIHLEKNNPHIHIMIPTRTYDPKTKELKDKIRILDRKSTSWEEVKKIRQAWADVCNEYLTDDNKISSLSYKDRGINKRPQEHFGPVLFHKIKKLKGQIEERENLKLQLELAENEIKKLQQGEITHGDTNIIRTKVYKRRDKETVRGNYGTNKDVNQRFGTDNGRPARSPGIPIASDNGQDSGYRESLVQGGDIIQDLRYLASKARNLAYRWQNIINYNTVTQNRTMEKKDEIRHEQQ